MIIFRKWETLFIWYIPRYKIELFTEVTEEDLNLKKYGTLKKGSLASLV